MMYQDVNQAPPPPPSAVAPFTQTMASAAASHVVHQHQAQQPALQYLAQQLDPASAAAAAAAAARVVQHHQVSAPNPTAMAMAASAIVAGGQQTLVKRVVKGVISGDYLILREQPRGGPPPEYYVNLAYVQAPRFNRPSGDGEGKSIVLEPWAWEAKEYLTKRLIGQEVFFRSEYTRNSSGQAGATSGIASGNRDFGIVFLGEENIVESMVKEGLLEVRRTKTESPMLQQLIEAEEAAKAAGKGRWSGQAPPAKELLREHQQPNQLKGKTFNGTVEAVRNGGALQVYLELEEGRKYLSANIMVSGIRCPDKNKATETKFSEEAKYFTESRLLNREVKVQIEKITSERNQTAFLASVFLGQNNLAEHLLRQGMARCFDASITLTKAPEKLRAAEREAKSKRLRIWENYVDKADGPSEAFEAKVLEVVSGDQLIVRNLSTNEDKKIFLASIRLGAPVDRDRQREAKPVADVEVVEQPKGKQAGKSAQPPPTQTAPEALKSSVPRIFENPILFNARELLRKKLIGKKVLVKVEYRQTKTDSYPEKLCCTVVPVDQPKWNCAEALVSRGYASVNKFMSDDSQRASNFDELLKAEQNALKSKDTKDKDKQKELAPLKIVDLCNDLPRAKQMLSFLARKDTRKDAVVEFVYSASRFKMFLAKENNSLLNLILAGVNVPREPEALKNEATAAAKLLVNQRDVAIQIENMDKKGNFIGWIYYKSDGDNKETSINLQLVKLGYAQVRDTNSATTSAELKAAEEAAREKKLGLWLTYQEPKHAHEDTSANNDANDENEAPEDEASSATANAVAAKEAELLKNRKPVFVTHAQTDETTVRVFVQSFEEGAKFDNLMKQLRSDLPATGGKKGAGEGYTPARNEIVAAKFSQDHLWYRAKVEKVTSPQDIDILFIDYGNREKVKARDLAKLSPKYTSPEPCAKEYTLAFIEVSTHDQDWVEEARRAFVHSTMGTKLLMRVEYKDLNSGLDAISLVDEQTKTDIGKKLVEEGLLITQRRRERKLMRTINEYQQAEKTARKNRTNMWQYGDFTKDDAKEFGHRSAAA